jgi:hypothetical protein
VSDIDMSVAGDKDQWMLLERASSDGLPLIVRSRINSAIADFAEANRVSAVICDVHSEYVRDDGMPTCLTQLYELEDQIVESVADTEIATFHTASATGDARRVLYFAADAKLNLKAIVETVSSEIMIASVISDLDFVTYRDLVTPTWLEAQFDGDRQVISNLEHHGDDGTASRKIDFWFYGERAALQQMAERLAIEGGFSVDHWLNDPSGVVLTIESSAEMRNFSNITPLLLEAADEFSVTYDGWETLVVSNHAPPESSPKPSLFGRLFGQRKNNAQTH